MLGLCIADHLSCVQSLSSLLKAICGQLVIFALDTLLPNLATSTDCVSLSLITLQYTFTPWPVDNEILMEYVHLLKVYSVACTSFKLDLQVLSPTP